jgi:hypothetical protein
MDNAQIVIVILIYHRHESIDSINLLNFSVQFKDPAENLDVF